MSQGSSDVLLGTLSGPRIIARPGKIVQVDIPLKNSGVITSPVVLSQLTGNAFYIVDSLLPLVIRTDQSQQQAYEMQMGESLPQPLGNLYIIAAASTKISANTAATTFSVKIWIGYKKEIGIIDNRTILNFNDWETCYAPVTNPFTVVTGQSASVEYKMAAAQLGRNVIREWLVANLDTANTFYIADGAYNPVLPVFPLTSIRIPVITTFSVTVATDNQPEYSVFLYTVNNSGSTIQATASIIIRTPGKHMELTT